MNIGEYIKDTQPDVYRKLKNIKHTSRHKEKLTDKDYENLMQHSSYKRHGGAIRQVK